MSSSISVASHRGDYTVNFVNNFANYVESNLNERDVIILDKNILTLYKDELENILVKFKYLTVESHENLKSYQGIGYIIEYLITSGFKKNNILCAIGGGITQDVTAFISSILYRGVSWIFFPTTLLAQCDSCIGSKTSINFGKFV